VRIPSPLEIRRGVLAVSVLHDVDVEPAALGVRLPGEPSVWVSWTECRRALAGHDPETDTGRRRLADWLLARRWAADVGPEHLRLALRAVGLPVDHLLHPGLTWVCVRVLGDALDLGLGAVGLDPDDPDRIVLLPTDVLDAAGIDAGAAWANAARELERLGALAADRLRLDTKGVLRPLGDADVVTLLGSRALRSALAEACGGLAAVVVPMRRRGWTRIALVDPAFGPAAAAATDAAERGFPRPLLLTADELTVVPEGGRPQDVSLRDPAVDAPWQRDVLYR
jgi:hypothetical protein